MVTTEQVEQIIATMPEQVKAQILRETVTTALQGYCGCEECKDDGSGSYLGFDAMPIQEHFRTTEYFKPECEFGLSPEQVK